MPQVKRLQARNDLELDCGHTIKAGESFIVTTLFSCERDVEWPLAVVRTSLRAAIRQLTEQMTRLGLAPKPVERP
jgi:hypothetical protein